LLSDEGPHAKRRLASPRRQRSPCGCPLRPVRESARTSPGSGRRRPPIDLEIDQCTPCQAEMPAGSATGPVCLECAKQPQITPDNVRRALTQDGREAAKTCRPRKLVDGPHAQRRTLLPSGRSGTAETQRKADRVAVPLCAVPLSVPHAPIQCRPGGGRRG
jgi:hypothetical protein